MGDSLDDFFAKKDKKGKGKKNFVVPDELVRQIEENGRSGGGDKKKRDKERSVAASLVPKLLDQIEDGEEWNDFEDEREKDYRGLKIQHLNIREEEEREFLRLQENGNDKNKDEPGPWKVNKEPSPVQTPAEASSEVTESKVKEKEKQDEKIEQSSNQISASEGDKKEKKSAYVPPALRNRGPTREVVRDPSPASSSSYAAKSSLAPMLGSQLRSKPKSNLPQINDEQDFPSL
ncbi:uncharacterized protein LOC141850643 [Brevipalpus obovatus]|uniref:uncharacterized protein LOC141850643 n=1 Tax=Brevipalpus obovatus TaxID=246614 RepID=UPI003D9E3728